MGVAYTLNQDDSFKHLVYDLLYDGKFKNWTLIRLLKYNDDDVTTDLKRARDESDIEEAQEIVDIALHEAKSRQKCLPCSRSKYKNKSFYCMVRSITNKCV